MERVLAALADGDVALVSDAGTPLVSDPGYKLGQAVLEQGHEIVALPGPSAVLTALSVSGLPSDSFAFFGFLPRKAAARRQLLASIKAYPATLIFFESPHRLQAALADLLAVLEAERPLAICRELTKLYEEVWRGTLAEANEVWPARSPRGEFTLVVGGAMGPALWDKNQVEETLVRLIAAGNSRKTAVQQIVLESGWSKKEVYTLAQQVGEE
ncbi:MAG: ribosomal RNA small subunit methyltransferase I [Anaerolineae bacterium]|nr:ribosomal RNA small subunit methyltransferase I [Anaerolineae bacterium]